MTKGQLAALWGLGVGVVSIFAILAYVLLRSSPPQAEDAGPPAIAVPANTGSAASSYNLPQTPYSARSLYRQVEAAASEWQPDAGLLSAGTSWSFADLDSLSEPVDWTFSFFSPSTQRIYVANVSQTQITPLRETLSPYSLPVIALDRWPVDSHQALSVWLEEGGGDLLQLYPAVNINAQLKSGVDRAVWIVIGATQESQHTFAIELDAVDGSVLE